MGFSSEMHIDMHNAAMESDAAYAEEYLRHWEEEMWYAALQDETESEADWRLSYDGYEEFRCELCGEFGDNFDCEKAWDAYVSEQLANDEDYPF